MHIIHVVLTKATQIPLHGQKLTARSVDGWSWSGDSLVLLSVLLRSMRIEYVCYCVSNSK